MMRSVIILSQLQATFKHEGDLSWSPWGTSRLLIQDADEGELRHPLQPEMSQEQTAIFTTMDCRGLSHGTNVLYHYLEIIHPEMGAGVSLMICSSGVTMPRQPGQLRLCRGPLPKGAPYRHKIWDNFARLTARVAKSRASFNNSLFIYIFRPFFTLFLVDLWTRGTT